MAFFDWCDVTVVTSVINSGNNSIGTINIIIIDRRSRMMSLNSFFTMVIMGFTATSYTNRTYAC